MAALVGAWWLCLPTALNAAPTRMQDVDAAVDEVMTRYRLPGLAVGIVEDGRVVYTRTEGELVAGDGTRIDTRTLFKIASNSKAMTAATLARLVDAGRLRWDDPVQQWLPEFAMHDPWVGRNMQVRDLLIHNSGLGAGAGDLMLWPSRNDFTREDIIRGLRHLRPRYGFRARYAYDNLLYIVAGEVAARAGGAPYDQLVQREVFQPLGMDGCRVGRWARDEAPGIARPHRRQDGRNIPADEEGAVIEASTMDAAGGIRCSLDDMLTWVRAWLVPEGSVADWLSPVQRAAVWAPQMPMPVSTRMRDWDNTHFSAYGYGWRLADVDGVFKVSHTGTLSGMYSAVTLLPDQRAGFVILINGDAEQARTVLSQVLTKRYTRPDPALSVTHYARLLEQEAAARPAAERAPDTRARRPAVASRLAARLGVYRDPWFGEASLCAAGRTVRFRAHRSPQLSGTVQQVGDRLLVDWEDDAVDAEAWLEFNGDTRGGMRMSKVDPQADFSYDFEDLAFERVRDCD